MKVFITGVAGMLGSHLSEILLSKNLEFMVLITSSWKKIKYKIIA